MYICTSIGGFIKLKNMHLLIITNGFGNLAHIIQEKLDCSEILPKQHVSSQLTTTVRLRGFFSKCNSVACHPSSLAKKPKYRSDSYFWIHEFSNKDHFKQFCRIDSSSWNNNFKNKDHFNIKAFCQADRLPGFHFEKPLFGWWSDIPTKVETGTQSSSPYLDSPFSPYSTTPYL